MSRFSRILMQEVEHDRRPLNEIVKELGVSRRTLSDWVLGKSLPSRRSLDKLVKTLRCGWYLPDHWEYSHARRHQKLNRHIAKN